MLDPDYLLRLSEGAEEISSQLHTEIIKRIVERIAARLGRGDDYILTAYDKWQIEVLQDAGFLREDIQKEIAQKTKLQLSEIKQAFEDAGIKSYNYDSAIYEKAGIKTTDLLKSPQYLRLLQRGYEKTAGEWYNFTGTFADRAQQFFISECDKAYNLVTTGAVSYTEAVKAAVDTISKDGVYVYYPPKTEGGRGHRDTLETATLRAVRTGVSQACAEITNERLKENNWDIVLVSAHLGARYGDGGENYTNHYWWQGKFYSLSGEDKRFLPFEVCGQGDVQGINGANCRHSYGPGDGENNPFEKYDAKENKKLYDLTQEQREKERNIRKIKRRVQALKTAVDNSDGEAKERLQSEYDNMAYKLKNANAEYKAFCEENGLKTLNDRLHIANWDRKQAAQASGAARRKERAQK